MALRSQAQKSRLDSIVARMKKTQRRNVVLAALKENGFLHCNNKYKRNLEVEVAPGFTETFKVYSVPKKFLTSSCQTMLNTISQNDVLIDIGAIPADILPIIAVEPDARARHPGQVRDGTRRLVDTEHPEERLSAHLLGGAPSC